MTSNEKKPQEVELKHQKVTSREGRLQEMIVHKVILASKANLLRVEALKINHSRVEASKTSSLTS